MGPKSEWLKLTLAQVQIKLGLKPVYKKLCYCRGTVRYTTSVEICHVV